MKPAVLPRFAAGFTMVELITVMILIGILGGIAATRFFDNTAFENRAFADQAKTVIRYAQKLAVAQNRAIYVRMDGNSFAVCSAPACNAPDQIGAPGGSNNGSKYTKSYCGNSTTWMCAGRPDNVTVTAGAARPEFGAGGYIYFDALGRPYNKADAQGNPSTFSQMILTFSSGGNSSAVTIWPETGYVQ